MQLICEHAITEISRERKKERNANASVDLTSFAAFPLKCQ
jgi:hypothetical protein